MSLNLYDLFHETVRRQPEHAATVGPGDRPAMTYEALDRAICDTAQQLHQAGLRAGDCVGVHYASGVQYIVLTYAVWQCGACAVPIAMELAPDEKREVCREISLDHLLSDQRTMAFAEPFREGGTTAISTDVCLTRIRSPRTRPTGYDRISAAFIRFTSGTTGTSKGVVLSHETIRQRIAAANEALAIGPDDRILWLLSMAYHFTVSIVSYLTFGAKIVFPANHFAAAVLAAGRRHEATMIYASPAHAALLADYAAAQPLPGLRLAISTTSSLDPAVAQRFHQRYGLPLTQALGIIEIGLPCINLTHAAQKRGSVGRVLPAYELRLEDIGLGEALQEISFRGPGMLDAYYRPWQTRDQIMPDGWFRTGDVGQQDADGCLFLRGRSKDVINVMGMKFFPQEVESVLAAHPAVAEACVFAQRDPRRGEVSGARVVLKAGEHRQVLADALRHWCAQRLASYKVPEQIEIVEALQRTASGKLLHRVA